MAAVWSGDDVRAVHGPVGSCRRGTRVGRSVVGWARSISVRDRLQRRLAHEASHDALTGLANRRTALSRIDEMLRNGSDVALLFLDLDGFKEVNDEHGHGVGDELLVTTADRLAAGSPDEALVARLGGDEFVDRKSTRLNSSH